MMTRRLFIDEKLSSQKSVANDTISVQSLRTNTFKTLIRDMSNEDFLNIQRYIEEEAINRSYTCTIALPMVIYEDINDFDEVIADELYKSVLKFYVDDNFPVLSDEQKRNLVCNIHALTKSSASKYTFCDKEIRDFVLLDVDTGIWHPLTDVGMEDSSFTRLVDAIENGEDYELRQCLALGLDNPLVVSTVADINARGIDTPKTLLYTFNIPLGKTYRIVYDESYGAYPLIDL